MFFNVPKETQGGNFHGSGGTWPKLTYVATIAIVSDTSLAAVVYINVSSLRQCF